MSRPLRTLPALVAAAVLIAGCTAAGGGTDLSTISVTAIAPPVASSLLAQPSAEPSVAADDTGDTSDTDDAAAEADEPAADEDAVPTSDEAGGQEDDGAGAIDAPTPLLGADCAALLPRDMLVEVLGEPAADRRARIDDAANAGVGMIGRTKCYYGIDDVDTEVRPLVLAIAEYQTAGAATGQRERTVGAEQEAGADTSSTPVHVGADELTGQIMLRDGGLLIVQVDTWTLSVALADGAVDEDLLTETLVAAAEAALPTLLLLPTAA